MADKNVKDTDIVERLRRLEEQVLPDGMNPSKGASGERLAGVLKGDGTEEVAFEAIEAANADIDGSPVVTQADGVAQHAIGDTNVHGPATLAELNALLSDADVRGESDFYDTDAGSVFVRTFATKSDVPTPLSTGTIVHVEDEDELYQQKVSGFAKVSPTRDIAFKDKAETFEEPDVTVSHNDTVLGTESIRLRDDLEGSAGSTATRSGGSGTGESDIGGLVIVPKTDLYSVTVHRTGVTDASFGVLTTYDMAKEDRTELDSGSLSGGSVRLIPPEPLKEGVEYFVGLGNQFSNYTLDYADSSALDTQDFSVPRGGRLYSADKNLTNNGFMYNISQIDCTLTTRAPFGSFTVGWPRPEDIYRWDAASFTNSPDGGNIEVYVEESTDGGSTWTEIDGPINRGDMITAAADSEVRFRVELSTTDASNNPTLDSIYRRYVV